MRKIVSFMHISVDGFAAGPNGEMDWIHVDDEIFDYAGNQTDNADTALYGRATFQMMDSYWPTAAEQAGASKHDIQHSNWYNNVEKIVLSHTLKDGSKNTTFISHNVVAEINALKQREGKNILIFGSPSTVHFLLLENLVDELWLFVNPVLIGKGISYLSGVPDRITLRLLSSAAFSSGVVCLQYQTI